MKILISLHKFLENLKNLDFIGLVVIRLYLFYVFWVAGTDKLNSFDEFSKWLGSLGLAFPEIFSWLVIATETGILYRMKKQNPTKNFVAASTKAECEFMKMITLDKVYDSLLNNRYEVKVPKNIADKARLAIERMLSIS